MSRQRTNSVPRRWAPDLADLCLLAALLLVLVLSWEGPEPARRPVLGDAARAAVERQLGVTPAPPAAVVPATANAAQRSPG